MLLDYWFLRTREREALEALVLPPATLPLTAAELWVLLSSSKWSTSFKRHSKREGMTASVQFLFAVKAFRLTPYQGLPKAARELTARFLKVRELVVLLDVGFMQSDAPN